MGANTTTRVGGNAVICSGSAVLAHGETFELVPVDKGPDPLRVVVSFASVSGDTQRIEPNLVGNWVNLRLVNFDNPNGTALKQPIKLGTIANREIKLNFAIYTIGGDDKPTKLFHYTVTAEGGAHV